MTRKPRSPAALGLPTLRDAAAASTSGRAAEAAHLTLASNGSAVDAVIAGFFAAAGADPGVLLGGVAAIVANAGSGVRAFDGRPLQPGKGAARPRGFVEGAEVPSGAFVSVPRVVPTLMLLHAYGGRSGLAALARHGVDVAADLGARERAKVLRKVGAAGVLALRAERVHDALLAAGNSLAGGSLTAADLEGVLPADADAATIQTGEGRPTVAVCPWAGTQAPGKCEWTLGAIAAADARGNLAVLAFAHDEHGLPLPSVELSTPRLAVPVLRGVTRVTPGVALHAPAPIGVARSGRDVALAFALSGAQEAAGSRTLEGDLSLSPLGYLADGGPVEGVLAAMLEANGAARCIATVRSPRATRAVVVTATV